LSQQIAINKEVQEKFAKATQLLGVSED